MEERRYLDLSKSLSLDMVGESSQESIPMEKEWYCDPISRVEVNESTEVTFMLLQHLSELKETQSQTLKPHIGPKPEERSGRQILVKQSRRDKARQLRRDHAARTIQRWFRSRKWRTHSEMKSTIACECGCALL